MPESAKQIRPEERRTVHSQVLRRGESLDEVRLNGFADQERVVKGNSQMRVSVGRHVDVFEDPHYRGV